MVGFAPAQALVIVGFASPGLAAPPGRRTNLDEACHSTAARLEEVPQVAETARPGLKAERWGLEDREESTMSDEPAAPETKGVTTEVLATVELGPEIEGMAGRQLRMRMVTMEPGGVFGPMHDHKDRPGIVYILQGTITDHRDGVATDYGPGVGWPEDRNTMHWLENSGTVPAVEISVDIVRPE
jgi:quercetin dioxygenase-like cupin family protein